MAQAAYAKIVQYTTVSGGASGWATIPDVFDASLTLGGEVLEDTVFSTESGNDFKSRMRAINDFSLSISKRYSTSTGSTQLFDGWKDRNEIWFSYKPNGTAGWKGRYVIENMEFNGDVNGQEIQQIQAQGDGGFAATT